MPETFANDHQDGGNKSLRVYEIDVMGGQKN